MVGDLFPNLYRMVVFPASYIPVNSTRFGPGDAPDSFSDKLAIVFPILELYELKKSSTIK